MYKLFIKIISIISLLLIMGCSDDNGGTVFINTSESNNSQEMDIYNPPSRNITIKGVSLPPSIDS